MRTDPCCHIYAIFLYLPVMCCAGFFIEPPCRWQKHLLATWAKVKKCAI